MQVRSRFQVAKRSSKASRTTPNGIVFDSRGEMQRWFELLDHQDRGLIRNLQRQVTTEITFIDCSSGDDLKAHTKTGKTRRYTADFTYEELVNTTHGERVWTTIYEDYKGVDDPASEIRRSLFELSMIQHREKPRDFRVRITGPAKTPRRKPRPQAPEGAS